MPSLSLKSDGPVAKFLGFVVGEPTYKPSNFCAIFWLIALSPIVFLFCRIIKTWCFFKDKIDTAIANSLKRQAQLLAVRYEQYPDEALIDWYQHYSRYRYDIRDCNKVRSAELVEAAFRILGDKFNEQWWLEVLVKIGATTETNENAISNRYFELVKVQTASNTVLQLRSAWQFWQWPLAFLALFTFCFMPVIFSGPEGALVFSSFWLVGALVGVFIRLELHIVVYNVYRAVKDRTCPLIVWE